MNLKNRIHNYFEANPLLSMASLFTLTGFVPTARWSWGVALMLLCLRSHYIRKENHGSRVLTEGDAGSD